MDRTGVGIADRGDERVSEAIPSAIARYQIRRELGRGMMGIVYEAHDPLLGRTIALKTIQLAFALGPKEHEVFEARFFTEARIAARLSHPGIVVVHDVGRDGESGLLYMALEYLEGRTLADVIKQGAPIEWREALRIVRRVAEALHHAHSHGVIHRDIKPGNIMLLRSGEPKIMDFGIAKMETTRIHLTAAGQFFGTPLYMSPEQALGRPVDRRSDLFSLGAIAYSLLTARPAFHAESITKIVTRVIHDDPPAPSHVVLDIPAAVDHVVARALAKHPADRYPNGRTMAEDVEDILADRLPRHSSHSAQPGAEASLVATPDIEEAALELDRLLAEPGRPRSDSDLPTVDLDAQLATLVPHAAEVPTGEVPMLGSQESPRASVATPRPLARTLRPALPGTAWIRRLRERIEVSAIGVLVLAGLAVLLISLWTLRTQPAKPSTTPQRAGPAPATSRPATPQVEPGRLAIEFEHALKGGFLRIWVDRELVVERRLDARSRTISAFSFRKGDTQEFLELPPGGHDVEVQVAWDDTEKTQRIWGDFRSGATRRLQARIGGLFKALSLEWQ